MGDESEALDDQPDGGASDPRSPFYVPIKRARPQTIAAMVKTVAPVSNTIRALADKALARALTRRGQWAGFLWVRPLATKKGIASMVTKEVRCVARVGLDYESMASTQDGRESGQLPAENAGLPWGKWLQFPYLIEHKDAIYLRLYPRQGGKCRVRYRINGQVCRKEEIEQLCLAKEFRDDDVPRTCITLNINHLRRMR